MSPSLHISFLTFTLSCHFFCYSNWSGYICRCVRIRIRRISCTMRPVLIGNPRKDKKRMTETNLRRKFTVFYLLKKLQFKNWWFEEGTSGYIQQGSGYGSGCFFLSRIRIQPDIFWYYAYKYFIQKKIIFLKTYSIFCTSFINNSNNS